MKSNDFKLLVHQHLIDLKVNFQKKFASELAFTDSEWILSPFEHKRCDSIPLKAQEELAEISTDLVLQGEFKKTDLSSFWVTRKADYPTLSEIAVSTLLPFVSTYLCESGFSTMTCLKTSTRSCIDNIEAVMGPPLTKIEPRYDLIMRNTSFHPSH